MEWLLLFLGISLWGNYEQAQTIGEQEAKIEIYTEQLKQCKPKQQSNADRRIAASSIEQHGNTARKEIKQLKFDISKNNGGELALDYRNCLGVISPNAIRIFTRTNKAIRAINKSAKGSSDRIHNSEIPR